MRSGSYEFLGEDPSETSPLISKVRAADR